MDHGAVVDLEVFARTEEQPVDPAQGIVQRDFLAVLGADIRQPRAVQRADALAAVASQGLAITGQPQLHRGGQGVVRVVGDLLRQQLHLPVVPLARMGKGEDAGKAVALIHRGEIAAALAEDLVLLRGEDVLFSARGQVVRIFSRPSAIRAER